jgi:hypothetical protein
LVERLISQQVNKRLRSEVARNRRNEMTLRNLRLSFAATAILFPSGVASADIPTYTFSTIPASGNIQGTPGSTIGWGYVITNNDLTDWLVTTNLTSDPFANGVPDASLFDFPIIAPGASVSLGYDSMAGAGLFALTWNPSAPVGFTDSGLFTLSAEWWTGDPFAGGAFIQTAVAGTAAYSAVVSSPAISAVPEPNSFLLLLAVLSVSLIADKRVRAVFR